MNTLAEFRRLNTRRTSIVHVGGFRPTGDPLASNFGLRPLGTEGEAWPTRNGKPLLYVCQLNLSAAPFIPALLQDIALITFFGAPEPGELAKQNGSDWCLRAYPSLSGLVAIAPPGNAPALKRGFECRWEECDDHPNYDDPDRIVPDGFDDSEVELENLARTKIGGMPLPSSPSRGGTPKNIPLPRHIVCKSTVKKKSGWHGAMRAPSTWLGERQTDAGTNGSLTGSATRPAHFQKKCTVELA
jgi:hypothetical protein